jgi:hypothetical protein
MSHRGFADCRIATGHGLGAIEETLGCLREPAVGCPTVAETQRVVHEALPDRARNVPRCW